MAKADELEKLVALKEKGALSPEEFERAKSELLSPPKKGNTLSKAVKALLAIGLLFVAGSVWYYNIATNGTGIPACESTESTQTLQKAFDGSQFARTLNVSVIDITAAKEIQYDETKKTRFCTARIRMNNTNQVLVKFEMAKQDSGGFLLQFRITEDDKPTTASTNVPSLPQTATTPASVASAQADLATDKVDEVCRFTFDNYYTPFDKRSTATDSATMNIQCSASAKSIADEEPIIKDVVDLLGEAKIDPNNYRHVMANAMQSACIRNSSGIKGFSYDDYKRSQCGDFVPSSTKK